MDPVLPFPDERGELFALTLRSHKVHVIAVSVHLGDLMMESTLVKASKTGGASNPLPPDLQCVRTYG